MERRGFNYCCGCVEIGNLGWADGHVRDQELKGLLAGARGQNKGLAICTTVAQQTAAVRLLKANKFRILTTFKNPNTQNKVTVWGRSTL